VKRGKGQWGGGGGGGGGPPCYIERPVLPSDCDIPPCGRVGENSAEEAVFTPIIRLCNSVGASEILALSKFLEWRNFQGGLEKAKFPSVGLRGDYMSL
jgi:hypothetical protein